jgi:hypothetical protein
VTGSGRLAGTELDPEVDYAYLIGVIVNIDFDQSIVG